MISGAARVCCSGKARTTDPIDAAVVLLATDGEAVVTSDPDDIAHLARAAQRRIDIAHLARAAQRRIVLLRC